MLDKLIAKILGINNNFYACHYSFTTDSGQLFVKSYDTEVSPCEVMDSSFIEHVWSCGVMVST